MKKTTKRISVTIIALFCICLSVFGAYADMILEYDGYQYSIFNNTSLSLEGWDNRTPELVVPDTIGGRYFISVANNGLKDNTEITSVDFSQVTRLRRIGMYAFMGCTGLNQPLVLPGSLTTMNESAFQGCTALPEVTTNASLTGIPEQAFYGCSSLTRVNIADGLQSIGRIAFANCTSLEYVNIPESVTAIDSTAFYNDPNLTIGVWFGSYGHEYAQSHNIPYILLDSVLLGDANGDGYVNISDVTDIQRAVAEIGTLDDLRKKAADVNGDGVVTIDDATLLQMYLAEFETAYPIGEKA
jgi:hypothetical protein